MSKPRLDKNVDIPNEILANLLTPSEVRMLKNRWQITNLLEEGLSIRKVAEQVKVGTDTVVRVARMTERKNLREAINKINGRITKKGSTWIFGKSNE